MSTEPIRIGLPAKREGLHNVRTMISANSKTDKNNMRISLTVFHVGSMSYQFFPIGRAYALPVILASCESVY